MTVHQRSRQWLAAGVAIGILVMTALLTVPEWVAADSPQTGSAPGNESCLMCHSQLAAGSSSHRAHGLGPDPRGSQATVGCISCHGPSAEHAAGPRNPPTITFPKGTGTEGADDGTGGDSACLSCHSDGTTSHWAFGEHSAAGVGCASCHSIHTASDPVQERGGQFQVCTSCHQREKMEQMTFSRHPLKEGQVQCSDCHAPHGGSALNDLTAATLNDTCDQCHVDKRGPFLFEHEPVQDDCGHCHLPHASVNDHLLKARQPMLCQQCHIASRHPGTVYDSARLMQRDINIIGQSCTNCHSQVHGGNQPANSTFRR